MADSGQTFSEKFPGRGGVLHKGIMIRSFQEGKRFTNTFFSDLKTVYLNIFLSYGGI